MTDTDTIVSHLVRDVERMVGVIEARMNLGHLKGEGIDGLRLDLASIRECLEAAKRSGKDT